MTTLIDLHAHFVPQRFPAYAGLDAAPPWPQTACDCGRTVLKIGGEDFRALAPDCWDVGLRLEAMDRVGIATQAISPMPELLSYWLSIEDASHLCRFLNDEMEAQCEAAGGRLVALGAVPLQDIERAIGELEALMQRPAFRGVEVGSNVNGEPIGSPRFRPFFAAAEALGAVVFVHALHPVGADRLPEPRNIMAAVAGYPSELAMAMTSLVMGGSLRDHPALKLAVSHGGGGFVSTLPRLQQAWTVSAALRDLSETSPLELARRVHYDTLVFDPRTLRHLAEMFGDSRLLIGTDFPFRMQDAAPLATLAAAGFTDEQAARVGFENAARLLGLG